MTQALRLGCRCCSPGVVDTIASLVSWPRVHKGIIIGKGGSLIKKIGSYARQDIEKMLDSKVFLDLYVRVKENWRDSGFNISDFGFKEEE